MLWVGRESRRDEKERKKEQRIQNCDTLLKATIKIEEQFNGKKKKTQGTNIIKEKYKRVSFFYHKSRNIRNTWTKVSL